MLLAERYRTLEILGHGGMGEVYRGCDELLGRPVAVKLLRPDLRDPMAPARFQHEARAAAVVHHPGVVAVYDFGHSNGEYYLVMELVEGRSLAGELALNGPFDADRALGAVREVAAGLAAAHRHGIVHRDIKPDNLLIDADGSVKIADFGIARSPADPATTSAGVILGTSLYLAPERAIGRPATAASDVYALGCVLYQMLTGHPPFQADNPTEIMSQHVQVAPAVPDELAPSLAHLLRRMLSKEPDDRPSAAEVATWTYDAATDDPTAELEVLRPRPDWQKVIAVLAALLVAGSAVAAGVLSDQQSAPPASNVSPAEPTVPAPRPTVTKAASSTRPTSSRPSQRSAPTPAAASRSTLVSTSASTSASTPSASTGHTGKAKPKKKKPGKH